jgi:lipoate-protein ligase A
MRIRGFVKLLARIDELGIGLAAQSEAGRLLGVSSNQDMTVTEMTLPLRGGLLDLTLPTAAENVALDEALLLRSQECGEPSEVFRLWEPAEPFVVIGRGSQYQVEVNQEFCAGQNIPAIRRCSGGAAIVTGPGCLMYGVVLSLELRPELRDVSVAHQFVLQRVQKAIGDLKNGNTVLAGTSDLAITSEQQNSDLQNSEQSIGERKFSGNSLRVAKNYVLYHGTLLYDFDLSLVSSCLGTPPRQPDYRERRSHEAFVANLDIDPTALRNNLAAAFEVTGVESEWPREAVRQLVAEKYSLQQWNQRH